MPIPMELEQDEITPAPSHSPQQYALMQAGEKEQVHVPIEFDKAEMTLAPFQPLLEQLPHEQLDSTILPFTVTSD